MRSAALKVCHYLYCQLIKPALFLFDAAAVHNRITSLGKVIGYIKPVGWLMKKVTLVDDFSLRQTIGGIYFKNPIGLAAGFDYEAKLTQILPAIGFGFGTVGTITNQPCKGNAKPQLGRLIKSRSLLVNKGFKNLGIRETLRRLRRKQFEIPIGLSIGATNTSALSNQDEAIRDIIEAFKAAENSAVPFSYYELNISCPNLQVKVEFYLPQHLNELLAALTKNSLSKPLFIKMPIDKSDDEALELLKIIVKYPIKGVIFGNLQKDRREPTLNPLEVKCFPKGNFSGKPTEKRANELISLAYKTYGEKLAIIGCGGVFSPEDAYKKIKLGASLVQLITGMIYEGPQLIAEINLGLIKLLKADGVDQLAKIRGADTYEK